MRVELCLPLALLFLSSGHPSNAQKTAPAPAPGDRELRVAAGAPLLVECALRVEQRAEWRLDGRAVPADLRPAGEGAPRDGWLAARLRAPAARADHAGQYTCAPLHAPHQRVRVLLQNGVEPSPAPEEDGATAAAERGEPDLYFDRSFELNCTDPSAPKDTYSWSKNDTELSKLSELRYELLEGGAVLRVKPAHEHDHGNYSCRAAGGHARAWRVWGRPHAKLPANTNVVEGQKLKLTCKVVGKPAPEVTWRFRNGSSDGADAELGAGALEGRVSLEAAEGVAGSVLVLAEARRADAGVFTCVPGAAGVTGATTLRVKDMYAALWPFLGICAEVFVLCAIILVYEKRRTKPELDDSDTDNHEQKKA